MIDRLYVHCGVSFVCGVVSQRGLSPTFGCIDYSRLGFVMIYLMSLEQAFVKDRSSPGCCIIASPGSLHSPPPIPLAAESGDSGN